MQTNDTLKPTLHTILTPSLLELYEIKDSVVVIIDVFRATSTMATALFNGASKIIPVDSAEHCIEMGKQTGGITAGERDGKIIPGLAYGNFHYKTTHIRGSVLRWLLQCLRCPVPAKLKPQ
jgi:2-phosphosulfolactate phosphatase